jgi:hypothetical protein
VNSDVLKNAGTLAFRCPRTKSTFASQNYNPDYSGERYSLEPVEWPNQWFVKNRGSAIGGISYLICPPSAVIFGPILVYQIVKMEQSHRNNQKTPAS